MGKKQTGNLATASEASVGRSCGELFALPLAELPCLQVFGLPFDSEGETKVRVTFVLPNNGAGVAIPKHDVGNRGLVKISVRPGRIEIATQKIWGLSWNFFRKQFGAPFAKFLAATPDRTELTVEIVGKKATHRYRGIVAKGVWSLGDVSPAVAPNVFASAWAVAALRDDKRIRCADDEEADAVAAAAARDKFLRGMGVKRSGLTLSCEHDDGHLAALLFQHRHGREWQFAELAAKKPARRDALEVAIDKWRETVAPSAAAVAAFEKLKSLLAEHAAGGPLKPKTQEFPPKYELALLSKKGEHAWDFANVAAVANDVYFDLYPLGLDVTLRDRVSDGLRKKAARPDDSFKLSPRDCEKFYDEICSLVAAAAQWFKTESVAERPLPPCQSIDQCLIEPTESQDEDDEPDFDSIAARATRHPLHRNASSLKRRLEKQFGKGDWHRAELELSAMLPGWSRPCTLELHWYDRGKNGKREPWKIKRFVKSSIKPTKCDRWLTYAAKSDYTVSLERGTRYRCTVTLGRRFQAYVCVVDESGDEYWYPERFFVEDANSNKKSSKQVPRAGKVQRKK